MEIVVESIVPVAVRHRARVPLGVLAGALVAWLGLDMVLLWRFLGLAAGWSIAGGGAAAALAIAAARGVPRSQREPTVAGLAGCVAFAVVLLLIGGEGRVFYENADWIVRDAVLRDMAVHPWPFAYTARGLPELLRAPIGMYLVPALAMRAGGQAAGDLALLAQNALLLGTVLAMGGVLFRRGHPAALALVTAFSGLDVIGAMIVDGVPGFLLRDHLEWWSGLQYSSAVTLAFWTPQHALAGWIGAVGYMLWHDRRLPVGVFLLLVPLTILWSPLAALGVLPFAALAGWRAWRERAIGVRDVALPLAGTVLAVPALLYLSAAGDTVGVTLNIERWTSLFMFLLLEVAPFAWIAWRAPRRRFGAATVAVAGALLLALPLVRVGWSMDLMMRASIPALAILSVILATRVLRSAGRVRIALLALVALGAVTGGREIARAFVYPASPPPRCSFIGAFAAWGPNPDAAKSNYLAAVARLPAAIRPDAVTLVPARDPRPCLDRDWPKPPGFLI